MFWRRRDDEAPSGEDDRLLEQLSAYLDGELTDAEMAEVEALIASDDTAADLLGDLSVVSSAYGAIGEVRAPRSFAIPADAAGLAPAVRPATGSGGSALALFRRSELFMRASAAVAALFFVVALVNNPSGSTPTATLQSESVETFAVQAESANATGPALEPAGAAGAALAPAPGEGDGATSEEGIDDGEQMGTLALPAPDEASETDEPRGGGTDEPPPGTGGGTADSAPKTPETAPATTGDTSRTAGELRPLPTGTELIEDSSQGVGGMAPALGVLAGLLTALSALTAWARRSGNSTR
ncbi:MAG: anti-sigma factor [Dehalococcoidia bacterium]